VNRKGSSSCSTSDTRRVNRVNQILKHFDDVSFSEIFIRIKVVFSADISDPQAIYVYPSWSFFFSKALQLKKKDLKIKLAVCIL